MMGTFLYIPISALFAYVFLFMTMLAAKKDRLINAFLLILGALLFWTGGSFFMRLQLWPSVKFWYDVSILGLLLLGYALFNFAYEFSGCARRGYKWLWGFLLVVTNAINISTGFFLSAPRVEQSPGGEAVFIYNTQWPVVFFFIFCTAIIAHMFYLLVRYRKRDEMSRRQFAPIITGIVIMFLGHIGFLFPFLSGFPTDILAGVLFAACLFFALYRRRLFKLTLLVSRGSCYAMSAGLSVLIFINLMNPIEGFIRTHLVAFAAYDTLIIALTFTVSTFLIYYIMKRFLDAVFVRDEMVQAENLREFSLAVSKSLQVDEILGDLVDVIQKTIAVRRVYVCIAQGEGAPFTIARSTSPLDRKSFSLARDNPVVQWLQGHDECLLMKDFRRTVAYKSMWEQEKKHIADLGVECFVPLRDEEGLVGIVLLTSKEKNASFTYDDLSFLSSVDSVGSIAVKNSRLYEKAYLEARTDELTGLYNRKYFSELLQQEFEKEKDPVLSLLILNLDDFKLYNQLYGNREGDIALQNVARVLAATVGENGYVARYSGKEFAAVLPGYDPLAARQMGETMRRQIMEMNKRESDYALKALTVSVGICSSPYVACSAQQMLHFADMAVYNVKRSGKNAVMLYTQGSKPENSGEPQPADGERMERIYSEYANTIYALTAAIDAKDHYTFSHSKNVAYYAVELAYACGMNQECVEIIKEAALLHDVGKIGIPEHILNKPGRLTDEEYEIMKGHVENSIGIIRHLPSLDYVIPAVIGHHERYDGRGYPRRLAGEDIPMMARILCIADSFDAMISKRSYKQSYAVDYALTELRHEAGRQFDPKLAPVFARLVQSGKIRPPENQGGPNEENSRDESRKSLTS